MFALIARNKVLFSNSFRRRHLVTAYVDHQYLTIQNEEIISKYPQVWLRDNCNCTKCYHKNTQSRMHKFKIGVRAKKVSAVNNELLEVVWDDNHISSYCLEWLKSRDFNSKRRTNYLNDRYRLPYKLWAKVDFLKQCPTFDYTELKTTEGLLGWIEAIATHGVALINNAPKSQNTVQEIAGRIGFVRKTHYGETWVVKSKPNAKNFAYLSSSLPLHTDLPYYEYKPGVNLLHCFSQTQSVGGDSLIADGFFVADRLKQIDRSSFNLLQHIPVDWNDVGNDPASGEFHSIYRCPVINLDTDNHYHRINFSIPQRDSHFSVALEYVLPWYKAYAKLINILTDQTFCFKLKEGQVFAFNNLRIFHGRKAYSDNGINVREIIGAYLDWDIIYARWRSLSLSKQNDN